MCSVSCSVKQYVILKDVDILKRNSKGFNNVNYTTDKLEVKNGNIDLTYQYIMVTEFATTKAAMDYYTAILKSPQVLGESDPSKVFYFVISQDNLAQLARSKNISAYSLFFQKNYLQ